MNCISYKCNFKEPVGALFVPESVWGGGFALLLARIKVLRVRDIVISLRIARELDCPGIPFKHEFSSNSQRGVVVQEFKCNEVFLPQEGIEDFHEHSHELLEEVELLSVGNSNPCHRLLELWEIVLLNELSVFFWNDQVCQECDEHFADGEWHHKREAS